MHLLIAFFLFLTPQATDTNPTLELSVEETKAINEYIAYFNESIHGMLIVHRLLENNNQDINKYVDLEGYQINFYSNNDLPKNIFVDPDQWFYETSPEKMFENLKRVEANLPGAIKSEIVEQANTIHNICNDVNNIRFEVEDYIDGHDLTVREELYGVYDLLDKAVSLYHEFYSTQNEFESSIKPYVLNDINELKAHPFNDMYGSFADIHKDTKNVLVALRMKDAKNMRKLITNLESSFAIFKKKIELAEANTNKKSFQYLTIEEKVSEIIEAANNFMEGSVPKEYKLYGKYYYFHNSNIINKFNRYGNGFVNEMNVLLRKEDSNYPQFLEMPHFFQVIYPMKIIEQDYIISETKVINELPTDLEDRKIEISDNVISAETNLLELEVYDYKLKDNDIVSINFNGDWIYRDLSLESEPKKLKLKLNDDGVNYLLIHAESVGIISPNTVAIKYKIGSTRDEIILESDLNTSALLEFSVDN